MSDDDSSPDDRPDFSHVFGPALYTQLTRDDRCAHCLKTAENLGRALKKCTGCSKALYCSKICQRSVWRDHKRFCNSKSASPSLGIDVYHSLGYETAMDLLVTLKDWVRLNEYALEIMAQIVLYFNGGIDHNLSVNRAVLVDVEARVRSNPETSPVGLFTIKHFRLYEEAEQNFLFQSRWDELVNACERQAEYIRNSGNNPAFAGVIPAGISLHVPGVGIIVAHHGCAIYRPRCHDVLALDYPMQTAFMDLISLLGLGITNGFSYHRPSGVNPPDVRRWVVTAKKKWIPDQTRNWHWNDMAWIIAQYPHHFKSGMHPSMLWSTFDM